MRGENGPVSFNGVNATIDASVQNGPLSFRDSHGEIKGSAVNGPLSITGGSGNIMDLDGPAWVGGDLRAHVGNGPLRLTVPEGYQTGISLQAGRHAPFHCDGSICGDFQNRDRRMPLK